MRDISSQVGWELDNRAIGSLGSTGRFLTSNNAGGTGTIRAVAGTISGSAQVIVTLTVSAPVRSDTPGNAATFFPDSATPQTSATHSPTIVYPSSETRFPVNMYKVLFQWQPGMGNNLFRLTFHSAAVTLRVYTTGGTTHDRFEFDLGTWNYLAQSNPGGSVRWSVDGIDTTAPTTIYGSADAVLGFSRRPVQGAIYYWSTTVQGVRRATVSDAQPVDFFTPAQTGKCVACHTLSRNGARLAADVGGEVLGVVDVANLSPPVVNWSMNYAGGWMTFSPDTSRIVQAKKGILTLRDGQNGATIGANAGVLPLPSGKFGTYPDWSPDGSNVIFAMSASNGTRKISAGSIAKIPYSGGTWGSVETLVASTGTNDNNYYPMYSFDASAIAFVKATSGNSDNNDSAKLYLLKVGGTPVYMTALNQKVSNADVGAAAPIGNAMPTWAPNESGDYEFVAFTSSRAYGLVYGQGDHEQLWVAAIDPSAPAGTEPSFPAFRLPFQDVEENNHRPFWAIDVLAPPPPPDGGVPPPCVGNGSSCVNGEPCCAPFVCQPNQPDAGAEYACRPAVQ